VGALPIVGAVLAGLVGLVLALHALSNRLDRGAGRRMADRLDAIAREDPAYVGPDPGPGGVVGPMLPALAPPSGAELEQASTVVDPASSRAEDGAL
jgi:hypothetical protein